MRPIFPIAFLVLLYLYGIVVARNSPWGDHNKPPVSLDDALKLAEADLNDSSFYCVGASIAKNFTQGDWALHFSTEDGKEEWVSVGSDRSIRKSNGPFSYR